jgi:hypothetical protein
MRHKLDARTAEGAMLVMLGVIGSLALLGLAAAWLIR